MFEQIAALENQFKTPMGDSEEIVIAIKKLPAEYQPVLTAEMRKEGSKLTASHIENATFQHWWLVHGSFAKNTVMDTANSKRFRVRKRSGTCSVQQNLQQMWFKRTQRGRLLCQETC